MLFRSATIWNDGSRLDPNHRFDNEELVQLAPSEGNVVPLTELDATATRLSTSAERQRVSREARSEAHIVSPSPTTRRGGWRVRLLAVAASVVVAIFCVWAYGERNTYATGIGEQRSLALADGSTIELNTHSKIRVRFTADRRTIDLVEGQALFHVAKDKTRPFIVQSDGTKVRAVGTEFDVYRRMTGTTVTVIEGRVAVLPPPSTLDSVPQNSLLVTGESRSLRSGKGEVRPGQSLVEGSSSLSTRKKMEEAPRGSAEVLPGKVLDPLNAKDTEGSRGSGKGETLPGGGPVANAGEFLLGTGEQAILTAQTTVKPKQPDIAAATAWTQRRLVFQSATLKEVAEEFNRYNARQLVIKDPELADFHITVVFTSTDPSSLIHFLQARPGIIVTQKNDEILIARKLQ